MLRQEFLGGESTLHKAAKPKKKLIKSWQEQNKRQQQQKHSRGQSEFKTWRKKKICVCVRKREK